MINSRRSFRFDRIPFQTIFVIISKTLIYIRNILVTTKNFILYGIELKIPLDITQDIASISSADTSRPILNTARDECA